MPTVYNQEFIQKVKDASDITNIVSLTVRLSKRTGSTLFGLCPFHGEKTPSFAVYPDQGRYYCYGCHENGDVVSFVQKTESMTFPEAIEYLAEKAGIPLPEKTVDSDPETRRRQRVRDLNREAAQFFRRKLEEAEGAPAVEYLAKRQISPATSKSFGLGYAPASWNALRDHLLSKGFTLNEMEESGLVKRSEKGTYYDFFRNRLVFPVINARGNKEVLAFSARTLSADAKEAKYVNSKETPIYTKGQHLFGLNLAKKSARSYFILVEGNVDVVSLHQAGFDCAVASLGTAFTLDQALLLSRFKNEVIIAYDSDNAGRNATQKAIKLLDKVGIAVRVLSIPDAKDPDDFIKLKGAGAFELLLRETENDVDYRLRVIRESYDLNKADDKIAFIRKAGREIIAPMSSKVAREVYCRRLAEMTGIDYKAIMDDIESIRRGLLKSRARAPGNSGGVPDSVPGVVFSNPKSAAAEKGIIRLLVRDSSLRYEPGLPDAGVFTSPELSHIFSLVLEAIDRDSHSPESDAVLLSELSQAENRLFGELLSEPENLSLAKKSLQDYISRVISAGGSKKSLDEILKEKQAAEKKADS